MNASDVAYVMQLVQQEISTAMKHQESRAERRERIATALAPVFAAERGDNPHWIADTCDYADMLIAELDRREAADRSEQ